MRRILFSKQYYAFLTTVPTRGNTMLQEYIDLTQAAFLLEAQELWQQIEEFWHQCIAVWEHELLTDDEGIYLEIRLSIDADHQPTFFSLAAREQWEKLLRES